LKSNTPQIDEEIFVMKKMRRRPGFFMTQNAPQARLMQQNALQAFFLD